MSPDSEERLPEGITVIERSASNPDTLSCSFQGDEPFPAQASFGGLYCQLCAD
jgi:hypothetical protein